MLREGYKTALQKTKDRLDRFKRDDHQEMLQEMIAPETQTSDTYDGFEK